MSIVVDKTYCSSSFLLYRFVHDRSRVFSEDFPLDWTDMPADRVGIASSEELYEYLSEAVPKKLHGRKCGIALSGGIDSAVLLSLVPKGTIAYTFRCLADGVETADESIGAKAYLRHYGDNVIEHKIVPVYWEDMVELSPLLMARKGAPIHSIEVQIYKAALQAKADGCDIFLFGETADCVYGGHSSLLSRDWSLDEFVERWSFVRPEDVLFSYENDYSPYREYEHNGMVDVPSFLTYFEAPGSLSSYVNACSLAGIEFFAPYSQTVMSVPLDLERVRGGENKYIVREVFSRLYPDMPIPPKRPMPRPTDEWLAAWRGPKRPEFLPGSIEGKTGDQRWLIWALERFLDQVDNL